MTVADLTWESLEVWGFEREECPEDAMRQLPLDVTTVDSRKLMGYFTQYTEWKCYAAARLADTENRASEFRQNLKIVTNQAALRADGTTITARKAAASLDPDVQEAEEQLLTAESLVTALRMVLANADDRRTLISRELSRRQSDAQFAGREAKWST